MRNYVQPGEVIDYANSGSDIAVGAAVAIGDRVGVAAVDIPKNTTGSVAMTGVFELAKDAAAITQGAAVYLSSGKISATNAGTDPVAGYAFAAAKAADSVALVALNA